MKCFAAIFVLTVAVTLCNAAPGYSGFGGFGGGYPVISNGFGGFGHGGIIAYAAPQPIHEIHHIYHEAAPEPEKPAPAPEAPAPEPAQDSGNAGGGQQAEYGPPGHQSGSYAAPAASGGPY